MLLAGVPAHQQAAHCEHLAKLAKPCETKNLFAKPCETCICESLRKLVFAKPCESCETNVKLRNSCETLRNSYLRNLRSTICETWRKAVLTASESSGTAPPARMSDCYSGRPGPGRPVGASEPRSLGASPLGHRDWQGRAASG